MKTIAKFSFAALAILAAASCTKEFEPVAPSDEQIVPEGYVAVTLDAQFGESTKAASLGEDLSVSWELGDSLAVYYDLTKSVAKFKVTSVSGTSAKIWGLLPAGDTAKQYIAIYPYSANQSTVASGKLTLKVNVPSIQTIPSGKNIDPMALVSVAETDSVGKTLYFKNVVSLMKFKIAKSGVESVVMKGNNAEKFVGTETIADSTYTGGSNHLSVFSADGTFAEGDYFAAVVPVTFNGGFKVATYAQDGTLGVTNTDKEVKFARNSGVNLGAWATETEIPNVINDADQFVLWGQNCSMYPYTATVKLGADIDLDGYTWTTPELYYGNFDGQNHRVYNIVSSSLDTKDVGCLGRIGDGVHGVTVKNLCVGSKDYNFDTKTGTYDGNSKFTFETSAAGTTTYYYAGAITYLFANSTIENVVNFTEIEATNDCTCNHRIGGVSGTMKANTTIRDCVNFGKITDNSTRDAGSTVTTPTTSGIVGAADGTKALISGCVNYGNVKNTNGFVNCGAAIVAYVVNTYVTVENCINYGEYKDEGNSVNHVHIGAIVGYSNKANLTIKGCKNYGNVIVRDTRNMGVGGIIGTMNAANLTIENSENHGLLDIQSVSAGWAYYGGILGYGWPNTSTNVTVKNCNNTGNIIVDNTRAQGVGGIVGKCSCTGTQIENCTNKDTITAYCSTIHNNNANYGGIIGITSSNDIIKGCKNYGLVHFNTTADLAKNTYIGGVAGLMTGTGAQMLDCHNYAEVRMAPQKAVTSSSTITAGLIAYYGIENGLVENCSNEGRVIKTNNGSVSNVGGLIGYLNSTAKGTTKMLNCTNSGEVIDDGSDSKTSFFGGIIGDGNSATLMTLEGCTNSGEVKCTSTLTANTYFGGVVSRGGKNLTIKNCHNTAKITPVSASQDAAYDKISVAGGVCGNSVGTVDGCTNTGDIYADPGKDVVEFHIGGIASGNSSGAGVSFRNCSNTGNITVVNSSSAKASYVGGAFGQVSYKTVFEGCSTKCKLSLQSLRAKSDSCSTAGGFAAIQVAYYVEKGADPVTIAAGCTADVDLTVNSEILPYSGIAFGHWRTKDGNGKAENGKTIIGSQENPLLVAGSVNGTTITADNLATYAQGSSQEASEMHELNVALLTK